MISSSQDEYSYSDYDNRPIRPMNQEALNETLSRLPILIDEDEYNRTNGSNDSSGSIKTRLINRRQPILAYSTRRKPPLAISSMNTTTNHSLLHVNTTIGTPKSNKRKLGGFTPTVTPSANKVIKQIDCRQELLQLKEENRFLEEAKSNLQLECALLKSSHETAMENLEEEHQKQIDDLNKNHRLQCEQFKDNLDQKEQLILKTNVELENLRNDHKSLIAENEKLNNAINDYRTKEEELTSKLNESDLLVKQLRDEIEALKKVQQQQQTKSKQSTSKSGLSVGKTSSSKSNATERTKVDVSSSNPSNKIETTTRSKPATKVSTSRVNKKDEFIPTPASSINVSLNKSNSSLYSTVSTLKQGPSKSKTKVTLAIEEKKRSIAPVAPVVTDKRTSLISTRTRSKAIPVK